MIRIIIHTEDNVHAHISELYDAVRNHTRVWSMSDLRKTKNLKLVHSTRNTKGIIRRINTEAVDSLYFECKAIDATQEALTAGRFVNLALRHMTGTCNISIQRNVAK